MDSRLEIQIPVPQYNAGKSNNSINFKIKKNLGEGTIAVKFWQEEEELLFVRPIVKLT